MTPPSDLRAHLTDLRSKRRLGKRNSIKKPRTSLTAAERQQILAKTSSRCHLCGDKVENGKWQADHVFAHSAGGTHDVDNYPPFPANILARTCLWQCSSFSSQWHIKVTEVVRAQLPPNVNELLLSGSRTD